MLLKPADQLRLRGRGFLQPAGQLAADGGIAFVCVLVLLAFLQLAGQLAAGGGVTFVRVRVRGGV